MVQWKWNFPRLDSSLKTSTCPYSARFKYRDRGSCNEASLISEGCSSSSSSRRRSMSAITGPPTGFSSPFASYTSFPSNPYPAGGPLSTPRDCALQMDQYLRDKEEQLQSRGLITEDLTTRGPVASIERDDSRWSHNNHSQTNMPEDSVNASITVKILNCRSKYFSNVSLPFSV